MLAHKIRLYPTADQEVYFKKASGTARFAYNWALAEWTTMYERGERTTAFSLCNKLTQLKKEKFTWMYDVTKAAHQRAILNLGHAFDMFFKKKYGYPKFKKKGVKDSFRVDGGVQVKGKSAVKIEGNKIHVPKLGWVKMAQSVRFSGQIISAVISRVVDNWFVALDIKDPNVNPINRENQAVGGVDLGIKSLAITNDGDVYNNPKALRKNLRKLSRLQRKFSRTEKGSAGRRKLQSSLARQHLKILNVRKDSIHKATKSLVTKYATIGLEDLNVRGMLKNRRLSLSVHDAGFYEFKRQLEYKAKLYGTTLVQADRWYPSSKTCSSCGFKLAKLPLQVRSWVCPSCETSHDRDINAAKNLAYMASLRPARPEVTHPEIGVQGPMSTLADHRTVNLLLKEGENDV